MRGRRGLGQGHTRHRHRLRLRHTSASFHRRVSPRQGDKRRDPVLRAAEGHRVGDKRSARKCTPDPPGLCWRPSLIVWLVPLARCASQGEQRGQGRGSNPCSASQLTPGRTSVLDLNSLVPSSMWFPTTHPPTHPHTHTQTQTHRHTDTRVPRVPSNPPATLSTPVRDSRSEAGPGLFFQGRRGALDPHIS